MTLKTASCHCGELRVTCKGEPLFVAMCHCSDCQRRTGSSYNLGAWFDRSVTIIEGVDNVFRRRGDEGMELAYHFCPACGSTVYWEAEAMGSALGVAGGCFADADFPLPTFSFYGKRKHQWLQVPEGVPCHIAGPTSEKI